MKSLQSLLLYCTIICLLLACKKSSSEPPPPKPIAYYSFDNALATNSASSVLQGKMVGTVHSALDSFLIAHRCLLFPGDGYVEVKDSDLINFPGNQFTIAAWIRPKKTKSVYVIIKNDEDKGYSPYTLDIYNGVVRSFVRAKTDEQFIIEGTRPIIANAWQHIAATFTGEQLTVYYNGIADGSVAVDRPLAIKKGDLAIGGRIENFPSASFQGSVDNVYIYDKALTAAQVKKLYQNYNQ